MSTDIDNDCATAPASLAELVRDPLIGLLMDSDGVDRRSIELLFERLAHERQKGERQHNAAFPGPGFLTGV